MLIPVTHLTCTYTRAHARARAHVGYTDHTLCAVSCTGRAITITALHTAPLLRWLGAYFDLRGLIGEPITCYHCGKLPWHYSLSASQAPLSSHSHLLPQPIVNPDHPEPYLTPTPTLTFSPTSPSLSFHLHLHTQTTRGATRPMVPTATAPHSTRMASPWKSPSWRGAAALSPSLPRDSPIHSSGFGLHSLGRPRR